MALDNSQKREQFISGFVGDVWTSLEKTLNFTTKLSKPSDDTWGSLNPDGTWTGIINDIIQNRTQIGISTFSLT